MNEEIYSVESAFKATHEIGYGVHVQHTFSKSPEKSYFRVAAQERSRFVRIEVPRSFELAWGMIEEIVDKTLEQSRAYLDLELDEIEKMVDKAQLDRKTLQSLAAKLSKIGEIISELNIEELKERELRIIEKLRKLIPPKVVELKEGEIKRLDDTTFIEKRDGKISIFSIIE
ncbi:MAG TPA: hypothetical protein EYP30_05260 [Archaeoglobaceae archaeon]|nr:hypothetical protein [Archaeoglobaceae archaeon]